MTATTTSRRVVLGPRCGARPPSSTRPACHTSARACQSMGSKMQFEQGPGHRMPSAKGPRAPTLRAPQFTRSSGQRHAASVRQPTRSPVLTDAVRSRKNRIGRRDRGGPASSADCRRNLRNANGGTGSASCTRQSNAAHGRVPGFHFIRRGTLTSTFTDEVTRRSNPRPGGRLSPACAHATVSSGKTAPMLVINRRRDHFQPANAGRSGRPGTLDSRRSRPPRLCAMRISAGV